MTAIAKKRRDSLIKTLISVGIGDGLSYRLSSGWNREKHYVAAKHITRIVG
jgi:hypothetical protein